MAIKGMEGVLSRVKTVLQDFVPAELDLIDTEQGSGTTPDIDTSMYFTRRIVAFDDIDWVPPGICEILPVNTRIARHWDDQISSGRLDYFADIDVNVWLPQGDTRERAALQTGALRYTLAIARVLLLKKPTLFTSADANPYATSVTPRGNITIQKADIDSDETLRVATVPIAVRMHEVL